MYGSMVGSILGVISTETTLHWTYRYTPGEGNTEAGRRIAIERALGEARLTVW